ncbi:hypothetical protein CEXT_463771 [Caerostris extrusa]|uniref:Uncharacterized protein n=1 Tax=Caerostris extrusa TaxID=172846 RepID=A0AAV4UT13_CAEEX|nr:hypothetical protein CEXT_463771 [Caerostris extrusa]
MSRSFCRERSRSEASEPYRRACNRVSSSLATRHSAATSSSSTWSDDHTIRYNMACQHPKAIGVLRLWTPLSLLCLM